MDLFTKLVGGFENENNKLRAEIDRLKKERAASYAYVKQLAIWLWKNICNGDPPTWQPLDNLMGVLTQVDNMITAIGALRAERDALKAQVKTLIECQCSWDYVTGESPQYFCGKCGRPMR